MELFTSYFRILLPGVFSFNSFVNMLNRFRNALFNVVGGIEPIPELRDSETRTDDKTLSPKFPYTRPHFLQFHTDEEIQVSADHHLRPIIVPRDISKLPWNSGYAEAVNAGKSVWNEDQACFRQYILYRPEGRSKGPRMTPSDTSDNNPASSLSYTYFGLFDGHAGIGAAIEAAQQLHHIIHEKLIDIFDHLLPPLEGETISTSSKGTAMYFPDKEVSKESLIVGALESAFWDMDELIAEDKRKYKVKGGCTALVALFILGKLYIANAGDSRAVLCRNNRAFPLSNDFTPETERQRIRQLAAQKPELLGGEYTHLDYWRKPNRKDLGRRILYRDAHMTGWAYKTVTMDDLKIPVVHGEGKRSRVLSTIGVTRGFGDHDLKALNSNIPIKPFLSSQPEVQVVDVENEDITESDVLIMGTDGLWDVTSNEKAAEIVQRSLEHFPAHDQTRLKYRYTSAAQDLVMHSRGKLMERYWRTSEGRAATIDDISVFVIPLVPYKKEHLEWAQQYEAVRGIYESPNEDGPGFGKLSLKSSPSLLAPSACKAADKPVKIEADDKITSDGVNSHTEKNNPDELRKSSGDSSEPTSQLSVNSTQDISVIPSRQTDWQTVPDILKNSDQSFIEKYPNELKESDPNVQTDILQQGRRNSDINEESFAVLNLKDGGDGHGDSSGSQTQ